MSLAELKRKSKQLIESLSNPKDGYLLTAQVGIKNFKVERHGRRNGVTVVKLDQVVQNHLVLEFCPSAYFTPSDFRGFKGKGTLEQIYGVVLDYWKGYAIEKGHEGVIVVGDKGDSFFEDFSFKGNENEEEKRFLEEFAEKAISLSDKSQQPSWQKAEKTGFHGAYISESFKRKIIEYRKALRILESVESEEKLFATETNLQYNDIVLFQYGVSFRFMGEKIEIAINYSEDERPLQFQVRSSNGTETIGVDKNELLAYLRKIGEERAMINLVETPMDNYLAFLREGSMMFTGYSFNKKDIINREFELLCEKIGGWKEVEEDFAELRNSKTKQIVNWKDTTTNRELSVLKGESRKRVYYFISFKERLNEHSESKGHIMFFESGQDVTEVNMFVSNLMTENVF